jgi:hypothetical protein
MKSSAVRGTAAFKVKLQLYPYSITEDVWWNGGIAIVFVIWL